MFYLEKCAVCDRSGSVALESGDEVCNLHKENTATVRVKVKKKDDESDDSGEE